TSRCTRSASFRCSLSVRFATLRSNFKTFSEGVWQHGPADAHLRSDLNNARGDPVPLCEGARCQPLADQNWITPAHKVPRPERRVSDYTADLVEAHHRGSQCRNVGSRRCSFLPASAFEIVIDDVLAIGAFSGQKVLERTAPDRRHEPIFAENCYDL